MNQTSVGIVEQLVEAWNRKDADAFVDLFTPDCEVLFPPEVPEPGPFHGRDELRRWFERFLAAWASHRVEILEVTPEPDDRVFVIARLTGSGKGSAIEMSETDAHIFTVAGGRISCWRNYADIEDARRASSE